MDQNAGGDYIMSLAYLLSWQGPVTEEEDPYHDGISPVGLKAAKHVQEVRILPEGDREAIKRAVLEQGGVQSSLYTSLKNSDSQYKYYQKEYAAYYYDGQEEANHDTVIVARMISIRRKILLSCRRKTALFYVSAAGEKSLAIEDISTSLIMIPIWERTIWSIQELTIRIIMIRFIRRISAAGPARQDMEQKLLMERMYMRHRNRNSCRLPDFTLQEPRQIIRFTEF